MKPAVQRGHVVAGTTFILMSTIFYGSYGIWTRWMGDSFGPFMQAGIRGVLVALIMVPVALYGRQKWQAIQWRKDKWWLALSVLSSGMIAGPLYFAINQIGMSLATIMMYAGYLLSMFFFGWLFNGERYDRTKFIATILALIGLVLTFSPAAGTTISLLAFGAAFAAGCGIGVDMAVSKNIRYNSAQTTVIVWAGCALASFPVAFLAHEHVPLPGDYMPGLYLLAFALVNIGSSWASIHGVKMIEVGTAGIIGLLEIVWAVVFGVLLFSERPHVWAYVGVVCILAAATIPYRNDFKRKYLTIEELPA